MKSTRRIVVAGWLIALPVLALAFESPADPVFSDDTASTNAAPRLNGSGAFEAELERLREDIAATRSLREKIAAEVSQPLSSDVAVNQEYRRELLEMLTKLATRNVTPKSAPEPAKPLQTPLEPPAPPAPPKADISPAAPTVHPLITNKIVDPFALGRALFRAGDYVGAEQAFRKAEVTDSNRVMLQYLIATCLRKQSRLVQAAKAYRIVSENKEDPALRDLALWQLENIRWHQTTESQLKQLRQLRESADPSEDSSQADGGSTPLQ